MVFQKGQIPWNKDLNGITLCEKCHRKTFGKEWKFHKKYFNKTFIIGE